MIIEASFKVTKKKIVSSREYNFNYTGSINGKEVKGQVSGGYSIDKDRMRDLLKDKDFLLEKIMEKEL